MIIAAHVAAGAAIGTIPEINPALAFLAGFLSHYVLDFVPHLELSTFLPKEHSDVLTCKINFKVILIIGVDLLIAALVWLIFFWHFSAQRSAIFLGSLGALTPDILDNSPFWSKYTRKMPVLRNFYAAHIFFHQSLNAKNWYWGLILYIIMAGGFLWYLLKF